MAKSKAEYWLTEDGLLLLTAWARDGFTDEEISARMGLSRKTLYNYKESHLPILHALKKGKEIVDIEVENALLQAALDGQAWAVCFWLKNRRSDRWRDRQEYLNASDKGNTGNIIDAIDGKAPILFTDEPEPIDEDEE